MLHRVGQSDPHAGRSFQSFAADVVQVADKLGIRTFFVVGVRWGQTWLRASQALHAFPAHELAQPHSTCHWHQPPASPLEVT